MPTVTVNGKQMVNGAIVLLLLIHATLLGWMAWRRSPAIDEPGHLVAGLSHWHVGGFDQYCVNPPLVRRLATIPLLSLDLRPNWNLYTNDPYLRPEFSIGADFADANGVQAFWCFTLARWACIPFSIVGEWLGVLPVPVPASYLAGIDLQRFDFEKRKWSCLRVHARPWGIA